MHVFKQCMIIKFYAAWCSTQYGRKAYIGVTFMWWEYSHTNTMIQRREGYVGMGGYSYRSHPFLPGSLYGSIILYNRLWCGQSLCLIALFTINNHSPWKIGGSATAITILGSINMYIDIPITTSMYNRLLFKYWSLVRLHKLIKIECIAGNITISYSYLNC